MTLARIITHSDLSARELAFHLLGRGYAVEIVSPDSIPDNFADLELRVDADSGDQLVASLAAYEGQPVSTLKFLARMKAPKTVTPPVGGDAPGVFGDPVVINIAPTIDDTEAPADSPNWTSPSISLRAEDALESEARPDLGSRLCSEEAAHVPPTEEALPSSTSDMPHLESLPANIGLGAATPIERTVEPLSYFARQTSSIALPFVGPAAVLPLWKPQLVDRRVERKSVVPAALALTVVVLLAVFLAFGVRQSAKASDGSFTSVSTVAMPGRTTAPSPMSGQAAMTGKPGADLHIANRPHISSRHVADMIAPDTVTYLDGRYKPAAKAKPLHAKARSIRRARGDVATDTTTYLNSATSPPAAK